MGYGPGVALYTVFGAFACYSGYLLWDIFLHLDSDRYPLFNFGDMFYRVYGKWACRSINVAQFLQMILIVFALILGNGQSISHVSKTNRWSVQTKCCVESKWCAQTKNIV